MKNLTEPNVKLWLLMVLVVMLGGGMSVQADSKSTRTRDPAHYEQWLSRQVRHKLLMLPWYTVFDNLEYSVHGYRVTLEGQVTRPVLKSDAESAVKHIEGVEGVDNRIEVLPLSPFDDRIRRAEYRAIYSYPMLQRYSLGANPSIHIIVKNGNVTLEGVVANQADRNVANIRANGVPDVFSVTNHLAVENRK